MSAAKRKLALGAGTVAVIVDMQRIFAELPGWRVASLPRIVPRAKLLALHRPDNTVFTRFITAESPTKAKGAWQHYYLHWRLATRDRLEPGMLDLIAPLAGIAQDMEICDKSTYSPFEDGRFERVLRRRRADTLVLGGVETDVCVLATVLGAVDRGLRVVVASDAVTSSCLPAHVAALDMMFPRYKNQIEIATTRQILAAWRD